MRPAQQAAVWAPLMLGSVLGLLLPAVGLAQLSPGELSAPHAELEGSLNCLECHSTEKGVDPQRCLSCHRELSDRIRAGAGLHARPDYQDCKTCHIDHHGREFELVWWGDEGMEALDHDLTGHSLAGAHASLACRDCHRAELNRRAGILSARGKDLERTFLGLGTDCLSCHRDEHRGQFEAGTCESCHSHTAWLPVVAFRHEATRFALTGLHRQVECEACHRAVEEPLEGDPDFLLLAEVAFASCSACHRDPHDSRLGGDCESCHTTAGWQQVREVDFDHDRTRYPLRGRHREVACQSCHLAGRSMRDAVFFNCTDCHEDEHVGQLTSRADGGRCESCHTVEGFSSVTFGIAEHDSFLLEGAHGNVACEACHATVTASSLSAEGVGVPARSRNRTVTRFRFASSECSDCHADPHAGTATVGSERPGCDSCHRVTQWSEPVFDHDRTAFPLDAAHGELECRSCHGLPETWVEGRVLFAGLRTECGSCHRDPHAGQFAPAGGVADCLSCHQGDAWSPAARFDHNRDASYRLEGAHVRVPCGGCHRSEQVGGEEVIRYKPLAQRCVDCHTSR